MLCYAVLFCTMLCYAMLCHAVLCCTMLCHTMQDPSSLPNCTNISCQLANCRPKCSKCKRSHPRQRERHRGRRGEIEQQARLIQVLSTRLMEPTALPTPTDSWQPTANPIASLKATRPGRPSMNASGSSRAASSDETAAKTAGWSTDPDQSALRHQRGGDNPRSGGGGATQPRHSYAP